MTKKLSRMQKCESAAKFQCTYTLHHKEEQRNPFNFLINLAHCWGEGATRYSDGKTGGDVGQDTGKLS